MKIALSIALTFLLLGCQDDAQKTPKTEVEKVAPVVVKETKTETKTEVKKEVKAVKAEVKTVATVPNGEKLFQTTCMACHGAKAEKKALSKSQVIQGWSVAKIEDALHGYKNKTYGKTMKTIMEGKTKDLSDAEIKALAEYISKL